jgi:8-oxo-dGTP pyrophosphatase MutT (NUDIX family)
LWAFWARSFSAILHIYFRIRRGMTLGVRAVVRSPNGEFLLVRHTYTPGWHFPGGGVEVGQAAEIALADELAQETGLCVSGRSQLLGIFFNRCVSPRDHVLLYPCDAVGKLPIKPLGLEISELGYFAPEGLPPAFDPRTAQRIREVVFGNLISREW